MYDFIVDNVKDYNEILDCLLKYNDYFNPNLTSTCKDIKQWAKKLSLNANNYIYKDKKNHNIVGMISFYNNDTKTKIGYLTLILVDQNYARKGIGSFLLNEFKKYCQINGMKILKLEVFKENINAIKFYLKNNYKFVEENEKSYYMEKNIE